MGLGEQIQRGIRTAYYNWGHFIGRKPKTTIGVSLAIALLACLRLFLIPVVGPLPEEVRQEYLFAPQDSRGFNDMVRYDDTWGASYRGNVVYFTTAEPGGNVLTKSVLEEVARFATLVSEEVSAHTSKKDGTTTVFDRPYFRSDLCAPASSQPNCSFISWALELWWKSDEARYDFDYTDEELAAIVQSGYGIDPLLFPPGSGRTLETSALIGGKVYDDDGVLVSAAAIALYFYNEGAEDDTLEEKISVAWEEQLNLLVGPQWTIDPIDAEGSVSDGLVSWSSDLVTVYPWTNGAIGRELSANIQGDIQLFMIGIFVLIGYTVFVLVSPKNCLGSRGTLLIAGLASTGIAIGISFALATLFVESNVVINVLPFVLIGIGVDDMFVLVHALGEVPADTPVPERMALAMGHAGASITVTSLTDIIAFLLGTTSALPGLSAFCVFAVFGILADFLMQISFFAGWMALDAYREARGRHDCFCCNPCGASCPDGVKHYPRLQDVFRQYYVVFLGRKPVKAAVLTLFIGYCAAMAWCASNLKQDFDREWFVNSDAKVNDAWGVRDDYFASSRGMPVYTTTPPSAEWDYAAVASQQQLLELKAAVDASAWTVDGSTTDWYSPLRAWAHACVPPTEGATVPDWCAGKFMVGADGATAAAAGAPLDACFVPPAEFYGYLAEYLTTTEYGASLASDFRWVAACASAGAAPSVGACSAAEAAQGLAASKLRATYVEVEDSADQVTSMRDVRESVDGVGAGGTYAYTYAFVFFEQYAIIIKEALLNLALAATASFFLVLLTVSDVRAALFVVLCVIMVDIDILGLMWLWGLTIDSVTIINLVLAIGLVVDYSAHVAHAFVIAQGTKQERMDQALANMGSAVFHGAMSTFAAVVVLGGSTSYIYRVFFTQFFGICVFGAAHGLCFLPVLLSLAGPPAIDVGAPEPSVKRPAPKSAAHAVAPAAAPSGEMQVGETPPTKVVQTA